MIRFELLKNGVFSVFDIYFAKQKEQVSDIGGSVSFCDTPGVLTKEDVACGRLECAWMVCVEHERDCSCAWADW